jgi:SAM-dependent methyltransferase
MTRAVTRHLDLGCGSVPRNPYQRDQLFGVDISAQASSERATIVKANLALEPIPFADAHFDSVSAYDFIEHVPRVLNAPSGDGLCLPFIELMNEISRVLKPGGLLYALTPAYPSADAFVDPTHVNVIAEKSHLYFVGAEPLGRMYGFKGHFLLRKAHWVVYKDAVDPLAPSGIRQWWRYWRHKLKGKVRYIVWEFERA